MNSFVIGDLHSNFFPIYNWLEDHAQNGDVLVSVGDFGLGFVPDWLLDDLGFEAKKKGVEILVQRGNHDFKNPFDKEAVYGDNLKLVSDYSTRIINGKKFLFIGGAISIDRVWRTEGKDYWKDEKIIYDLSLLDDIEGVDVLITHTCPDFLNPAPKNFSNIKWAIDADRRLKAELIEEREYITKVWGKLKEKNNIKECYMGHFHVSLTEYFDGCKFRVLNIDEIVML